MCVYVRVRACACAEIKHEKDTRVLVSLLHGIFMGMPIKTFLWKKYIERTSLPTNASCVQCRDVHLDISNRNILLSLFSGYI